jgi:hypothetical protein
MNRLLKLLCLYLFISISIFACKEDNDRKQSVQKKGNKIDTITYYYKNYHCFDFNKKCELESIKLINKDSIIYVRRSQSKGHYTEIIGKINAINDSIFCITPSQHFAQNGNKEKPYKVTKDSIYFFCDSSLIGSTLTLEYLNGEQKRYLIQSTSNIYWVNENLFNIEKNRIYISINHKNPITNENIELASLYSPKRYSVIFKRKKKSPPFYIIINKSEIKSLNSFNKLDLDLLTDFNLLKN